MQRGEEREKNSTADDSSRFICVCVCVCFFVFVMGVSAAADGLVLLDSLISYSFTEEKRKGHGACERRRGN